MAALFEPNHTSSTVTTDIFPPFLQRFDLIGTHAIPALVTGPWNGKMGPLHGSVRGHSAEWRKRLYWFRKPAKCIGGLTMSAVSRTLFSRLRPLGRWAAGVILGACTLLSAPAISGAADVPFKFEANSLVYEGTAKLEGGHLTGDASSFGGTVHLDGTVTGDQLSVTATGNFAPGMGMGNNLLASGSAQPATGKITFPLFTSAARDYAASLQCRLTLDLTSGSTPAAAAATVPPTISAPAALACS